MIQQLSVHYQKPIAGFLFCIIYISTALPSYGMILNPLHYPVAFSAYKSRNTGRVNRVMQNVVNPEINSGQVLANKQMYKPVRISKQFIGGPSQPEMSSFKSQGAGNLVNLFTGDFSYNIPLLDVGGYPVNIFYNGGIGMEQEASWVGLGWNINPGNINRNMRGIPDDFNGEDSLEQQQKVKKNVTWSGSIGADFELTGIKLPKWLSTDVNASLGLELNNYLGPALSLGVRGNVGYQVGKNIGSEKSVTVGAHASVGANLSSRYGLTFTPSFSLSAGLNDQSNRLTVGGNISTAYNSRNGIRGLQISEQVSFSMSEQKKNENKNETYQIGANLYSTLISFAKPTYVPDLRMPITNSTYTGHFQAGVGEFGAYPSIEVELSKSQSEVADEDVIQKKPLVGYLYYEQAATNPNAVMDFTRFNDKEVTQKTPLISVPQYSYDVFSIQGEGTGGSIRAYRNDLGYVRDNLITSKDKNTSGGLDLSANLGHIGGNYNNLKTKSTIGAWIKGNKLLTSASFQPSGKGWENVYFRNPGESSVLDEGQYERIGGTDLVRFKLGGTAYNPTVEPQLERFSQQTTSAGTASIFPTASSFQRQKRTQVINFLTAEEASKIGLDTVIKIYNSQTVLDSLNNLRYDFLSRVGNYRKKHHISQINVTEVSGRRYIYGIPVYNIVQKDFTFSVPGQLNDPDLVNIDDEEEMGTGSELVKPGSSQDGYVQVKTTPAYAHSFLLSGLLSADYVDVTSDGISDDDLGDAVKFNYTCIRKQDGTPAPHIWRTPLTGSKQAHFNAGNRSEKKDDKGIVSYGERENWYVHSIESKTMIALFTLQDRLDGKGAKSSFGYIDSSDSTVKCLKQIDLYSKADLKQNGLSKAKPIKTVHLGYTYKLCLSTPDHPSGNEKGKLTLDTIYFSYNGQHPLKRDRYIFSYGADAGDNPGYQLNASDRWGGYKPRIRNPAEMKNSDYPYSLQSTFPGIKKDSVYKKQIDQLSSAWSLKKILLPSGGQIEVGYESDDYAFVQNRRAAGMMQVVGFGGDSLSITNKLFRIAGREIKENDYVFIRLPEACHSMAEAYNKYLEGIEQLAFKLAVNMPRGQEYITAYANYTTYDLVDTTLMWVRLKRVDGMGSLSLTALEYLRQRLPGQAFKGYDLSENSAPQQVASMIVSMIKNLTTAFSSPLTAIRLDGSAQTVDVSKSFVRLNDPDGFKYGGGHRVKSVSLKDNWKAMTGQYTSTYTQTYCYTTTEMFHGKQRTISSGVASYEPSVGGEENPFLTMKQLSEKLPLGPASYESVELPVLDAFFPAPGVGYSKVTVRSLPSVRPDSSKKSRSGIGKQVTEFYTARDFPVYYDNTPLDPASDKQVHEASTTVFLYKYGLDSRTLSQGFLVATNDMHGKLKSQSSYAENDTSTRIYYTENFYRNTGARGLEEKFSFARQGGEVVQGGMGVDVELMTDAREFSTSTRSLEIQGQVDRFPIVFPIYLPFIWPVVGVSENTYRAVTTTKVISYHSMIDSVVVIDKGSQVSTKNLVFDAETGDVLVNRTNNEYDKPVYTTSYPAYWAYSGMGPAYRNINANYSDVTFLDGRITTTGFDQSIFESGDEIIINSFTTPTAGCDASLASGDIKKLWVYDRNKDNTALTNTVHDFVFMDSKGKLYTNNKVSFRIVRSGRRNMLDAQVASFVSMVNPVQLSGAGFKLSVGQNSKVLNAAAKEYREKWQTDPGVIKKVVYVFNPATCTSDEVVSCDGTFEKGINPYQRGLIGNFRPYRSMVFYGNRAESNPAILTNLPQNGSLEYFTSYWNFNTAFNLVPDVSNAKWVWNNQLTRVNAKGMELETKNALNIYTAAQYGYNKSLPTAIANNSSSTEMAYEGFEDNDYNKGLNKNASPLCEMKSIDFSGVAGSQVVGTEYQNFSAHSGKYVLAVNPSSNISAIKKIDVSTSVNDNFRLAFGKDTVKSLYLLGGNVDNATCFPESNPQSPTYHVNFINGAGIAVTNSPVDAVYNDQNYHILHELNVTGSQYVDVAQAGFYNITTGITISHIDYDGEDISDLNCYIGGAIADLNGATVPNSYFGVSFITPSSGLNNYSNTSVYLCKGTYKVVYQITDRESGSSQNARINFSSFFSCTVSPTINGYQSLAKMSNCTYTTPIAPNDSMLNPGFTIPAGKKMLLSTWVHEDCQGNCNSTSFDHNMITFSYTNINGQPTGKPDTIKPSGPIIDGWQRYEGYFIAPTGAAHTDMTFVNNANNTIYFDDIRLHPFHANMKNYVYDPVSLRLVAELDENNYASFYEYDAEGTLVRTKAETSQGIKTIRETRSAKQTTVLELQQ